MKNYICFAALACLLGLSSSFAQTTELKTYENEKYLITYPGTWTVKETPDLYPSLGIEFSISSPKQNEKDKFLEIMTFSSETLQDTNVSLETHSQNGDKTLEIFIAKYKSISALKVTSQAGEFYRTEFTGKIGKTNHYFLQFNILRNGRSYILSFGALKRDYKTFVPIFESMWRSFKFK
jgi:hypothetical protein